MLLRGILSLIGKVAEQQLHQDCANRPNIDTDCILRRSKHELWRTVVAGADVGYIRLPLDKDLRSEPAGTRVDTSATSHTCVSWHSC